MKNMKMIVLVALAVTLSFAGQALAGQPGVLQVKATALPAQHGNISPDVSTALVAGIVELGDPAPPDVSNNPTWPCFTGGSDPDCSSIAAGGLVVGIPFSDWSAASCNVTSDTMACGQFITTLTDNTANGKATVTITIKQGASVVFNTGKLKAGSISAGFLYTLYLYLGTGPNGCTPYGTTCVDATAGPATLSVTTAVGKKKATGTAVLVFQ